MECLTLIRVYEYAYGYQHNWLLEIELGQDCTLDLGLQTLTSSTQYKLTDRPWS